MPPKKRKNESTAIPKAKRQKIVDKDPSSVDSGFQNLNKDIAKKILDHLKLVTNDLKALSQTCSSWHVKITTYYREMFAHILPFSYQTFTRAQKLKTMAEMAQVRQHISDIQILEFTESLHCDVDIKSVPWCPNIVFLVEDAHCIIDLRKPDPIVVSQEGKYVCWGRALFSANAHRKQVLVSQKSMELPATDESTSGKAPKSKPAPTNQMLYIYDVSNDGKVDLVRKIDTKTKDSSLAAFLQDDGTVWLASSDKVEIFREDAVEIYNYPDRLGPEPYRNIMGFIEHHGAVKFLIQDLSDSETYPVTFIYNSKTRQHEKLPVICNYQETFDITYISDSLQFHEDTGRFSGSCSLDPTIQRQIKVHGEDISISPDGSRIIEYEALEESIQITLKDKSSTRSGKDQDYTTVLQTNILFLEEPVEEYVVDPEKKKKKKKKSINRKQSRVHPLLNQKPLRAEFFWLSNDIIISVHDQRIAILDFRSAPPAEGFKSFGLPFTKDRKVGFSARRITRFSDDSFVIWLQPYNNMVGYKITI